VGRERRAHPPHERRERDGVDPVGLVAAQVAVIRERTLAGLAPARARGRLGGRPPALSAAQVEMARALLADRTRPIREVYTALHVSRSTLYRHVPTYTVRTPLPSATDTLVHGPQPLGVAAAGERGANGV
jgi:hypothetical protein